MSKRDDYVAKLKQTVDELNEKISDLEVKANHAQTEAKAEIEKQITSLKEQAKPLTDKLDHWKEASEEKMDEYLKEAKKIRDAFVHSYNYFKSQLK
jgi:predicted  nucleic acid-binding Zn-ribbon protein